MSGRDLGQRETHRIIPSATDHDWAHAGLLRPRRELVAENMMLRQQLIVASRKVKKPCFRPHERCLLVILLSIVRRWREALHLVKPDTQAADSAVYALG